MLITDLYTGGYCFNFILAYSLSLMCRYYVSFLYHWSIKAHNGVILKLVIYFLLLPHSNAYKSVHQYFCEFP